MLRIHIDSNVIAAEIAHEAARREVRRQRELNRERTFIFSEGLVTAPDRQGVQRVVLNENGQPVMARSRGVRGDSLAEELADKAAEFKAAQKKVAAVVAAA